MCELLAVGLSSDYRKTGNVPCNIDTDQHLRRVSREIPYGLLTLKKALSKWVQFFSINIYITVEIYMNVMILT